MGGLDGVINAAGILAETGIADTTAEVFSRTVAVNLTGTFLVIQAAAPLIQKAGRGTIVNIASGVGLMPTGPGSVAYVASKGGVIALTRSVASYYARYDIRCNTLAVGFVDTGEERIRELLENPEYADRIRNHHMGIVGKPNHVAPAAVFMLSDEAEYISGAILPVDGGAVAASHIAMTQHPDIPGIPRLRPHAPEY